MLLAKAAIRAINVVKLDHYLLKPWDPATLIGAAALLAVVTVVTSIVPALKAANVNPIETLRSE